MASQLQITLRGIERSEALEARIRLFAERLGRFYSGIVSCRVVIEVPHHHHSRADSSS